MDMKRKGKLFSLALAACVTLVSAVPVPAEVLRGPQSGSGEIIKPRTEPAYVMQQLDDSDTGAWQSQAPAESKTLQGKITTIKVTRGRSQIVKFAQPIMRVSIAEEGLADIIPLAPDQIMINGKLRGVTSLIVWDENGQEGIFDLQVNNDTSEMLDAIAGVAPNEKIHARVTDDTFILTGQVSNSVILDEIRQIAAAYGYPDSLDASADKFKDLTETPVPQVALDVRIAEANRSVGRELKTSFNYSGGSLNLTRLANPLDASLLGNANRAGSAILPGQFANTVAGLGSLANKFGPSGVLQTAPTNVGGVIGGYQLTNQISALWDMLESSGKINLLANPTLLCTHGRTADFLAGGEFPFRSGTDQSGQPIISFKEFGVKLKFTPWIAIRTGRIELQVEPEVSSRDPSTCVIGAGGGEVCGILTRKTSTTVELRDGESLMISGILTREEQNTFAKVPFIGNVPVLGNFFKNANMSKSDRELVVIVTPRIVSPAHQGQLIGSAH